MVLVSQALAVAVTLAVVADMTAHRHTELLGGVNIWGYRGPVMSRKASNELRIATVGGDLAFGWASRRARRPRRRCVRPCRSRSIVPVHRIGASLR